MNPDDMLDRAARGLREQTQESVHSGEATLTQVLTSLRAERRRRRLLLTAVVPIGTLFFGLAGWAMVTGRWATILPPQLVPGAHVVPQKSTARPARPRPTVVPEGSGPGAGAPVAPSDEPPVQENPPPPVAHTVSLASRGRTTPGPSKVAPPAEMPAAPPAVTPVARDPAAEDDRLYQLAHEAHFARKDYAAALVAWNRYVMLGPRARFFLEARYNRAIALVRLDRKAEAVEALRPFAAAPVGSYRRSEARDLLRFLGVPDLSVP
jgi:TolA-binding protein